MLCCRNFQLFIHSCSSYIYATSIVNDNWTHNFIDKTLSLENISRLLILWRRINTQNFPINLNYWLNKIIDVIMMYLYNLILLRILQITTIATFTSTLQTTTMRHYHMPIWTLWSYVPKSQVLKTIDVHIPLSHELALGDFFHRLSLIITKLINPFGFNSVFPFRATTTFATFLIN